MLHKICHRESRIAINALNLEQSLRRSNRQKSNRAAMDNNYMLTILTACLSNNQAGYLKSLLSIGFEMRLPWHNLLSNYLIEQLKRPQIVMSIV